MRSDADLEHLCRLASVAVAMVRAPNFMADLMAADDGERHNCGNCLQILADAYVELAERQGVKPRFRLSARAWLENSMSE